MRNVFVPHDTSRSRGQEPQIRRSTGHCVAQVHIIHDGRRLSRWSLLPALARSPSRPTDRTRNRPTTRNRPRHPRRPPAPDRGTRGDHPHPTAAPAATDGSSSGLVRHAPGGYDPRPVSPAGPAAAPVPPPPRSRATRSPNATVTSVHSILERVDGSIRPSEPGSTRGMCVERYCQWRTATSICRRRSTRGDYPPRAYAPGG